MDTMKEECQELERQIMMRAMELQFVQSEIDQQRHTKRSLKNPKKSNDGVLGKGLQIEVAGDDFWA